MANKSRNPRYKEQGAKSTKPVTGGSFDPVLPGFRPSPILDYPAYQGPYIYPQGGQPPIQSSPYNPWGSTPGASTPAPSTPATGTPYNSWAYVPGYSTPATGTPMPGVPSINPVPYGPPQAPEYAPLLTNGSGYYGYATDPEYNWRGEYYEPAYQWTPSGELVDNPYAPEGAAAMDYDSQGRPWSSVYSKDFYANQSRNLPTWIAGRTGGGWSMGRGRMPGRYYIPNQEDKPKGNNNNNIIPLWAGPLVNWRK